MIGKLFSALNLNKNKNECIIIRCVTIGYAEKITYEKLTTSFPKKDIFFACDSDIKEQGNVISVMKFVDEEGLKIEVHRLGWRCGDHCFYAIHHKFPIYDYYWIIEPDVYIDKYSIRSLRKESAKKNHDLLIHNFSKRQEAWVWYNKYKNHYPDFDVYGGLFPLVRLSNKAVRILFRERKMLAQRVKDNKMDCRNYPNDESFTCSTLMQFNLSCASLDITENGYFNLTPKHFNNIEIGRVSHPHYYDEDIFREKIKYKFRSSPKGVPFTTMDIARQNNFNEKTINTVLNIVNNELG